MVTADEQTTEGYQVFPDNISCVYLIQVCNNAMYYCGRETIHNLLPSPTKTRRPEPGLRAFCAQMEAFVIPPTFCACCVVGVVVIGILLLVIAMLWIFVCV